MTDLLKLCDKHDIWYYVFCHKCAETSIVVTPFEGPIPKMPSRKDLPVFSGVMQYFPEALLAVAHHSKKGNDKHNPGEPLHWAKEKSTDQADCIARHLIDIGPNWDAIDEETGSYHATALAWRALALLQTVFDRKKALDNKKKSE